MGAETKVKILLKVKTLHKPDATLSLYCMTRTVFVKQTLKLLAEFIARVYLY